MNSKKTDCGAINPDLVEKVKPNMPKINLLFELSDFFKVMSEQHTAFGFSGFGRRRIMRGRFGCYS